MKNATVCAAIRVASFLAITCLASWCQIAPAVHAESLPEMVNRHDSELRNLRSAVEELQRQLSKSSPLSISKDTPSKCVRDVSRVGTFTYNQSDLLKGVELFFNGSGIMVKLVSSNASTNTLTVASNTDEFHNQTFRAERTIAFEREGCRFVMVVQSVTVWSSGINLKISLNYA
jgi:hypothetical protein